MEHVGYQRFVDVGVGHLLPEQLDKLLPRSGEVPLQHFQFRLVDRPLMFHVVRNQQRRRVHVVLFLAGGCRLRRVATLRLKLENQEKVTE